jgi:hypothetical protein
MIIVDRVEEGIIAVCEIDDVMLEIPLSKIKGKVRDGDVLIDMGDGTYTIDTATTAQRKAEITDIFERLKAKNRKTV